MHDDEGVAATILVRVDKTTIYQLPTAIYISTLLAYNLISCCKNPEFRRTYSKF